MNLIPRPCWITIKFFCSGKWEGRLGVEEIKFFYVECVKRTRKVDAMSIIQCEFIVDLTLPNELSWYFVWVAFVTLFDVGSYSATKDCPLLWRSWTRQMSQDVPVDAGLLHDGISVLGDIVEGTSCITVCLYQCFSTTGPRPGTRPWHQLYRDARSSPGICHFSFLRIFHE